MFAMFQSLLARLAVELEARCLTEVETETGLPLLARYAELLPPAA